MPIAPLRFERLPKPLDVNQFSAYDGPAAFGTSPEAAAARLRDLADQIEAKSVLIQAVTICQDLKREDYAQTYVTLELIQKREPTKIVYDDLEAKQ